MTGLRVPAKLVIPLNHSKFKHTYHYVQSLNSQIRFIHFELDLDCNKRVMGLCNSISTLYNNGVTTSHVLPGRLKKITKKMEIKSKQLNPDSEEENCVFKE